MVPSPRPSDGVARAGPWSEKGDGAELSPGQFEFTDPQATNSPQRFYRVRSP
jgi:hypothetical protein